MRLQKEPFELIKLGKKTIELRLYDEKRQKIKVGDKIEFTNRDTNETIETLVIALHRYDSFKELYQHFDKSLLGYNEEQIPNYQDMELYYPISDQEQYGVVGIEIKLLP